MSRSASAANPDTEIVLRVTYAELLVAYGFLGKAPYGEVAQFIHKLAAQAGPQLEIAAEMQRVSAQKSDSVPVEAVLQ